MKEEREVEGEGTAQGETKWRLLQKVQLISISVSENIIHIHTTFLCWVLAPFFENKHKS